MFHVIKHGTGREAVASIILMLCFMKLYDCPGESKDIRERLTRAYSNYHLWCIAEGKTISIKRFSRANLHYLKAAAFPYLSGKGSDTTLVLMYLSFQLKLFLANLQHPDHKKRLQAALVQVDSTLNFLGILHSHDLFLPRCCAKLMMTEGLKALRSYNFLAQETVQMGKRLFCLRPKFHSWAHTVWDLKASVENGDPFQLNPAIFNCEQNEDFIGRVSRVSRHVAAKTVISRTLMRYGLGFASKLRKLRRRSRGA